MVIFKNDYQKWDALSKNFYLVILSMYLINYMYLMRIIINVLDKKKSYDSFSLITDTKTDDRLENSSLAIFFFLSLIISDMDLRYDILSPTARARVIF